MDEIYNTTNVLEVPTEKFDIDFEECEKIIEDPENQSRIKHYCK